MLEPYSIESLRAGLNLIEVKVDADVHFEEPFILIPDVGRLKH
jgi:hypothetical protein